MSLFDPEDVVAAKKWILLFIGPIVALIAALFTDVEGDFTRLGQGYIDPLLLMAELGLVAVIMGLWKWRDLQGYSVGVSTSRGFFSITSPSAEFTSPKADITLDEFKGAVPKMRVQLEGVSQFSLAARPKAFLCYPESYHADFYGNGVCMAVLEPHPGDKHNEIVDYALSTLESVDGFKVGDSKVHYGLQFDTEKFSSRNESGEWVTGPGVVAPTVTSSHKSLNRQVFNKRKRAKYLAARIDGKKVEEDVDDDE
jgi:hypothetical protein